ncbi:MAG: peptidoglycan editing factor PgeF [Oleispira sp.]|nr:peptidoglycan editing factor PgeF [Oleispira sp.]
MIIPQWPAPANVKALATERESQNSSFQGVSLAPYHFFNLAEHVGDNPANVATNRQFLLDKASGCDDIRWLQQIHGIDCPDAYSIGNGHAAGASFTQQLALGCAVMTADCLPVLFCDLQGRQVAAAHAGWKGLAQGVLRNTLKTFTDNGIPANQVIAWLGPAISQTAFEVGPEVKAAFKLLAAGIAWADEECFIHGANDRLQANIYQLARIQLEYLGLGGIYGAEQGRDYCTYSDENEEGEARFFSYRQQGITGRQVSMIWLLK